MRKGLHDDSSDEGIEVDEGERVTIRSLDEKVAVGGKNFSTFSCLFESISFSIPMIFPSRSESPFSFRSNTVLTP